MKYHGAFIMVKFFAKRFIFGLDIEHLTPRHILANCFYSSFAASTLSKLAAKLVS